VTSEERPIREPRGPDGGGGAGFASRGGVSARSRAGSATAAAATGRRRGVANEEGD
jgi:hypothetical protein